MNQRPALFGETPRHAGPPPRPNDLSDQAALTIKMGNVLVKVREAVEKEQDVKLSHSESRVLLTIIRQSIDRAKSADNAARLANERARRAKKR